jgi:anti-sigma factor RsiW
MLTRKPSRVTDDAQDGNPQFPFGGTGTTSDYRLVPPTFDAGEDWQPGEPEACRLVSVNLSAYIDGELDPDQSALVGNHLNTCPSCTELLIAIEEADEQVQREWRGDTPLPSSSRFRSSVDAIMDALPPVPAEPESFAPKRVHARARWTRFAAGLSSVVFAAGLLWSSYRLGYTHGRRSAQRPAFAPRTQTADLPDVMSAIALCSLTSNQPPAPLGPVRERPFQP